MDWPRRRKQFGYHTFKSSSVQNELCEWSGSVPTLQELRLQGTKIDMLSSLDIHRINGSRTTLALFGQKRVSVVWTAAGEAPAEQYYTLSVLFVGK